MEAESKRQNSNPIFRKNSVLEHAKNWGICLGSVCVRTCLAKEKSGEEEVTCAWLRLGVGLGALLVSALFYSPP